MSNGPHILLIDGNDTDREYYAQHLKVRCPDFQIYQAASGETGLELYNAHSIDCVILELGLPDISGFEVLAKLVPRAHSPEIPVIVLTQLSSQFLLDVARVNGAQAVLQKTSAFGDLLESVVVKAISAFQATRLPGCTEHLTST